MSKLLLNTEQEAATNFTSGPSIIIAGAGTGKTRVLTEKIKRLVVDKKISPRCILALTFTEKAAGEIEERVDKALPYGYTEAWIMTFHSFADRILRENGTHIGISPSYRLLTGTDSVLFFKSHLHKFSLSYFRSVGNPTGFIDAALTHFSRLKEENISPENYLKYVEKKSKIATTDEEKEESVKNKELAEMYQTYSNLKRKENVMDFSDLLFYVVQLLSQRKHIVNRLQKQFTHCLVDEFQDTNIVQYELIKLLFPAQSHPQLTVIGDDNQSIYKFRGASISNILSFKSDYKDARMFVLNINYRSYQEILDSAYSLITHNNPDTLETSLGISKKLVASRGEKKEYPVLLHALSGSNEAEKVAREIQIVTEKKNFSYEDIALLVRANDHAKPFIQVFEQQGIPYQFLGPGFLYNRSEIRDLISLLMFIRNVHDSIHLYRVLSMPIFNISTLDLIQLTSFAKRISRSLFEVLLICCTDSAEEYKKHVPLFTPETKKHIKNIYELLIHVMNNAERAPALSILFSFLEKSGYLKLLTAIQSEQDEQRLQNITRFFLKVKRMEGEQGEATVAEVVDAVTLAQEMGESPLSEELNEDSRNAVKILTVHAAKGLEFPVVFLVNCVVDRFPTRRRGDILPIPDELVKEHLPVNDAHTGEERRLFYVGITRAQNKLFFSFADQYNDGKRKRKLSPFIYEALGEKEVQKVLMKIESSVNQLSIFEIAQKKKPTNDLKKVLKKQLIDKYSFTQMEAFEKCPRQYKYRYLLRIPEPENSALTFGTSVHKALELYYRSIQNDEKVGQKELIQFFRENFIPFGYVSKHEREKAVDHGILLLEKYFNEFHPGHGSILYLEEPFTIKIPLEKNFASIVGKIDRVDKKGTKIEIIDYKTGKMPAENELKKSLQLGIYALAALDKNTISADKKNLVLTFYYLDEQKKFSVNAQDRDLTKIQENIQKTITEMQNSNFEPVKGYYCNWCPFKSICPAWDNK